MATSRLHCPPLKLKYVEIPGHQNCMFSVEYHVFVGRILIIKPYAIITNTKIRINGCSSVIALSKTCYGGSLDI